MKLTDLPSPYRELAEMRHEQKPHHLPSYVNEFESSNDLIYAFMYSDTPENFDFWYEVNHDWQPEIPKQSLLELEAWKKAKGEFNPTMLIEHPDHRLFTAACHAMQGILANRELQLALYANHKLNGTTRENAIAFCAVKEAKALLAELDKTKC